MKKSFAIVIMVILFAGSSCSKQDNLDSGPTMDPLGGAAVSSIPPDGKGFSIDPNGGSGSGMVSVLRGPLIDPDGQGSACDPNGGGH